MLAVNPSLPVRNFQEFIEYARTYRAAPSLRFGGNGSQHHLSMEILKQRAGIDLLHVPFKGGTPATMATVAGDTAAMFAGTSTKPQIKAGKLRALAATGAQRSPEFPELPTDRRILSGLRSHDLARAGSPPAGTPDAVLSRLRAAVDKALAAPDVRQKLNSAGGVEPFATTPDEFAALIRRDYDKYGKIVKTIGIKVRLIPGRCSWRKSRSPSRSANTTTCATCSTAPCRSWASISPYCGLPIEEMFYRFLLHGEFDVSEVSFAKMVALAAQDDSRFVALPVFPSRVFRHSSIYVRSEGGISRPEQLAGKRVGVPDGAQTAAIYSRGLLAHEHGVDLTSIHWHQAGVNQPGRREKVALELPSGFRLTVVADRSLSDMLLAGDLDAILSARPPTPIASGDPRVRRLFADYRDVELAYARKDRHFPDHARDRDAARSL